MRPSVGARFGSAVASCSSFICVQSGATNRQTDREGRLAGLRLPRAHRWIWRRLSDETRVFRYEQKTSEALGDIFLLYFTGFKVEL